MSHLYSLAGRCPQWSRSRLRAFSVFVLLLLVPLAPKAVLAGSLSLAWDASPDASVVGYVVEWGENSGTYTDEVDVGNGT